MPAIAKRLMLVLETELAIAHCIHGLGEMASFGGFWDLIQASRTTEMGSQTASGRLAAKRKSELTSSAPFRTAARIA